VDAVITYENDPDDDADDADDTDLYVDGDG